MSARDRSGRQACAGEVQEGSTAAHAGIRGGDAAIVACMHASRHSALLKVCACGFALRAELACADALATCNKKFTRCKSQGEHNACKLKPWLYLRPLCQFHETPIQANVVEAYESTAHCKQQQAYGCTDTFTSMRFCWRGQ